MMHLPQVMHMFTDIGLDELNEMTARAYGSFNGGAEPLLMTPIGDETEELILLDASLGPTLAFKDIGYDRIDECNFCMSCSCRVLLCMLINDLQYVMKIET